MERNIKIQVNFKMLKMIHRCIVKEKNELNKQTKNHINDSEFDMYTTLNDCLFAISQAENVKEPDETAHYR